MSSRVKCGELRAGREFEIVGEKKEKERERERKRES